MKPTILKIRYRCLLVSCIWVVLLSLTINAVAQVPAITNISAQSAINGSSFTVTGTNFNTTPANNIVYIGKQRATVTASTATSLTVTAPSGGTYGKITVLNTATQLQCESQSFFSTRFPPARNSLSGADFTSIGTLSDAGGGLQLVASGSLDLNGDGKPEMISLNPAASEISVFPNTSSGGTVSFGTPVAVAMSNFCTKLAIADMDADGRKDLVLMAPNAGYILIFLNTGDISTFGETSNINVGTFLANIALSDINKDGRVDILVSTSSTSFLYIYPNFSTPGSLALGSFTSFSLGANAATIGAMDLNGDNMPDIVANFPGGVSIYKNLGTAGGAINSGSFSTAGTAAPNTSLSLTSATTISFVDFDNDGKTDLATSNGQSAVYTFINNYATAGGDLSFTAGTTITTGRNVATIATGDVTGDGKPDILAGMNVAFATNDYRLAMIPNQTTVAGTLVFGTAAELAAGNAPASSDIVDLDNDGRADFFTGNLASRTVSVYQNTTLPPPVISSFSPANAAPGASITITGTGFNSTPANNKVLIGGSKATVTAASATSLTVTVPKGALYGYVTVTNTANALTAYSKDYFLPTIQTPKGVLTTADIPYQGSLTSSSAQRIYGMVTGDLNGDGRPDLVTAANGPATPLENALQVYFNTTATAGGNITLATPNTYTFTGNNGQGMPALADLDGDGNLDIIAIASTRDLSTNIASSGNMYVLRNQGTGAFTASSAFTTGLGPNSCFAIDMDGDGLPDVATLNTTSASVSFFRNLSSGTGNISFAAKNDYSITANPIMIFFADLDGDGKPDLIIPRSGASGFDVKLNTSTPGNISFATSQTISGSNSPISVAGGDVDGDGKTDLILTFAGSSTSVSVYRNTSSGAGNISFATSTVAVGISQQVATLGDLNGDGKPDLVVAPDGSSPGKLIVYRNTSVVNTVSFDEASRIELTDPLNFSRGLAVADFNNDGVNDLVAGVTNLARFYVYRGIMQFPPTITSITPAKAAPGTSIVIAGTNFNVLTTGNVVYFGAVRATVTSAGATSLTVTVPAGASYGPVTVTHTTNRLTGQSAQYFHPVFAANKSTLSATDFALQATITGANLGRGFALADLDADGKPDIADAENILSNSVHFRKNNSTTAAIGFATAVDMNNGLYSTPEYIKTKDIDGDGKPDVLMTNLSTDQLLVALGTGDLSTIAHTAAFTTGSSPRGLDAGDLDGDGRIDVVVANSAGNSVSVFRNTGNAAGQVAFSPKTDISTTTSAYNVYLADMDGDGKLDIVTNGGPGGGIYHVIIWRNTTTTMGAVSFDAPYTLAAGAVQNILKLGDLDNDGKIDIIAANGSDGVFTLFNNNSSSGSLNFGTAQNITIPYTGFINDVSVGDLNGDGKADLSFSYASSPRSLVLYANTTAAAGTITFDNPVTFAATASVGKNYIQDVNGDGRPDIFSVDYNTHTIQIFQNSLIAPPVTQATAITVTPTGTTAALGWTNGSGEKRAVFMLDGNSGSPAPATGTDYTANTIFASGSQIGTSGWYCVYAGTGSSVTVTGLSPSKTYRVMVVEFNDGGQSATAQYNTGTATNNPVNFITPATLNSIVRAGSNASVNITTADYTVTFGSAVTGLTTTNFSLTASAGITGSSVQSVSGSGTTYTVTVNTGSGDGTLVLNLANATGLTPTLTNTLPFAGETYTIDKTVPTLTAVTIASSNSNTAKAKAGDVVTVSFTASETIITPVVTIAGAAASVTNTSGNNWTATYTMAGGNTAGAVTFNIAFGDAAGNSGTAVTATTNSSSVVFDETAPTLTAVAITSSNTNTVFAKAGDVITLSFTASESIQAPTLSIAGHAVTATNGSGNNWTATYTMVTGDATGAVAFNIAFSDLSGNAGTAVTTTTNSSSVSFDKTAPALSAAAIASSNTNTALAKVGDVITLSFTASEAIQAPAVTIAGHTVAAANSAGNNWTATYTMVSGDATGVVTFNIAFSDLAGNAGTAVTATTNSSSILFDKTAPTLSTAIIASSNTDATRAKAGDMITLSFTGSEVISAPTVTIAGHAVTATNTSGNNWTATYTMASGDATGVVTFNIAFSDLAGNAGTTVTATTNSSSILFDKTVPTLTAVTIGSSNADVTRAKAGDMITLSFTASEAISTPAVTIAGYTVTATNGSGNNWTATYAMATGDAAGPVAFSIGFSDLTGNAGIAVAATTNNSSVLFDKTAPALAAVAIASSNAATGRAKVGDVITLSFTASETIQSPAVTIAGHTVTATNTSGNNWTATYTMVTADATGTVIFNVSFSDLAGNAGTAVTATTNSSTVLFDKTAPTLSAVIIASSNAAAGRAKAGDMITLSFTASETIQSPAVTIAGHTVTATNTSGNNWTATYTMVTGDAAGTVTFNIGFSDLTGNAGTALTATTNSSSVLFDKTAPAMNTVTIASSHADISKAVIGSIVTLQFTATETIQNPTVTIAGHTVAATNTSGNSWTASYTMTTADAEGFVPFSIAFADLSGNTGTAVTLTTNSSNVNFLKTLPVLTLVNITSNNANTAIAIPGNSVIVSLVANRPILAPTVTIAGHAITATSSGGNSWTAAYTMTTADAFGRVTFSIAFTDTYGYAGTPVTATTNNTAVDYIPGNAAPSFTGGAAQTTTVCSNTGKSLNSLLSARDIDNGQTLTWSVIAAPAHGTLTGFPVTATATGSAQLPPGTAYLPQPGYNGTDQFVIRVSDGNLFADITVTINVTAYIPGVRLTTIDAGRNVTTALQARTITGASGYNWIPNSYLNNAAIANPQVTTATQQEYNIEVTVGACIVTDTLLVRVQEPSAILVPNVFTPNGDGQNDKLLPIMVANIRSLHYFRVYNRWGKMLFETSQMGQGWDGRYNGELQPLDTYTWIIEAVDDKGATIRKQGSVTLLR
ncbi:FG-GAP-like repeat-containing protein [Sediminibacterium ginsengisoli]|uniref:Gliding motility-associated C-terminal domain-containing protein n=1 Tax=Sediminibacterium ginsengisoli TaxID=413434 RepID=A0A1T4M8I9_9BACT|nr:FG-GAP-like repeat-containing protein [Sediminibacterium ginsengisoli]SJZ63166.1 gliding motility-associated C-terminal domain-containing protein [Sediminibacterium ginsengisoli]